jgi:hypothetical protein
MTPPVSRLFFDVCFQENLVMASACALGAAQKGRETMVKWGVKKDFSKSLVVHPWSNHDR